MKIAVLSPIAWRTPPRHYGPWEQMASIITEGLVEQGHEVTLFATADSITSAALDAACEEGYAENPSVDAKVWESLHISNLMEKANQFDVIHNHFDFLPLTYSGLINTPVVTTIHGFSSSKILPVYKKYNHTTTYVSISDSDRNSQLDYARTIYHGLDPENFLFKENKEEYLLYFGRIHPEKGTLAAIEIARKSRLQLKIAGLIQDQNYFETQIKPKIDNEQIIYLGNADSNQRKELLSNAQCLLHPINFDEPFGLSVAEAMISGTPVIAYNRGSMPELISHGKTGYLVNTIEEAVEAVSHLCKISPADCKNRALKYFHKDVMISSYIEVYKDVLSIPKVSN